MHGARFLGHSIHPMLVVFPLGLLATSLVFDLVFLAKGSDVLPAIAFWDITAGIVGGLLAAIFVERHGVSVDERAGPNAPGSLTTVGSRDTSQK